MKKTLLVLLLIASLITTAFAAKGPEVMLGVSSGFNEEVEFHENIDPTTSDIVPIKADALFYLGDSLAFNTALGMDIYIPNNEYRDPSVGFVADILAYDGRSGGISADEQIELKVIPFDDVVFYAQEPATLGTLYIVSELIENGVL